MYGIEITICDSFWVLTLIASIQFKSTFIFLKLPRWCFNFIQMLRRTSTLCFGLIPLLGNYNSVNMSSLIREVKAEVVDRSSIYGEEEEGWENVVVVDNHPYYETWGQGRKKGNPFVVDNNSYTRLDLAAYTDWLRQTIDIVALISFV